MRTSGVLLPIFSLSSPYGIGTIGKAAYDWVDFLSSADQTFWQVLPVGPTSYGDSPYQSFSAFDGNPYFIDLDILCSKGLLRKEECEAYQWDTAINKVDYALLYKFRFNLLKKAFMRFSDVSALTQFSNNNPWLTDYTLYMAIKGHQGGTSWMEWPEPLRTRDCSAIAQIQSSLHEEITFYTFLQYEFHEEWLQLKRYAKKKGVKVIGDLPIYVALDSADVWANPDIFMLDENRCPVEVAGCPPDAFSADGQLWGNPLYRWDFMKTTGYSWWLKRLAAAFAMFDVVRIDHFRGFESFYAIPFGDKTARNGCWHKGPGIDFIAAIHREFIKAPIIAEDLGFLTPEVKKLLAVSGFPGMKVLQFAFDTREKNDYMPSSYKKHCVVYTATHDNDTTAGWLRSAPKKDIALAREYLQCKGCSISKCTRAFVCTALASSADTAIIPLQDWLALDSAARINTPSTLGRNWQWRMDAFQLTEKLSSEMATLSKTYQRNR